MIKRAVCEVYQIDLAMLIGLHRGKENEPRNVAIFLARHLRRDTLAEVGEAFGITNYSSVSSIVEKVKGKIGKSRKLKKQIEEVKKRIHLSQMQF